jgi:hypothetical protein
VSDRLWRWRLRRTLRRLATETRRDLMLPDGFGGEVHVAWVLLRADGFHVLDTLEGAGQLIAGDLLPEWTLVNRRRFLFPNPLPALERERTAVTLLAGDVAVTSLLVLQDGLALARARPRNVVSLAELVEHLGSTDAAPKSNVMQAWQHVLTQSRQA